MNEMKLWAAGVCVTAVACALLEGLIPSGSMKKMFSFLVSAMLLLMIVSPLRSIVEWRTEKQWIRQSAGEEAVSDYAEAYTMEVIQMNLEECAAKELYESGIPYKNITAVTDIEEDGSIVINKFVVSCDPDYGEDIKETLMRTLQIPTEVVFDEG